MVGCEAGDDYWPKRWIDDTERFALEEGVGSDVDNSISWCAKDD